MVQVSLSKDVNFRGTAGPFISGTEHRASLCGASLPSFYHVQDTWANYDILARQIDAPYKTWRKRGGKPKRGR